MPKHDYASWKPINLNRDSSCAECGIIMPKGAKALWSRNLSLIACLSHGNSVVGEPGLNGKQVTNKGLNFVAEKMKDPKVAEEVNTIRANMDLEDKNILRKKPNQKTIGKKQTGKILKQKGTDFLIKFVFVLMITIIAGTSVAILGKHLERSVTNFDKTTGADLPIQLQLNAISGSYSSWGSGTPGVITIVKGQPITFSPMTNATGVNGPIGMGHITGPGNTGISAQLSEGDTAIGTYGVGTMKPWCIIIKHVNQYDKITSLGGSSQYSKSPLPCIAGK